MVVATIYRKLRKKWRNLLFTSKALLVVGLLESLVVICLSFAKPFLNNQCVDLGFSDLTYSCPQHYVVNIAIANGLASLFFFINLFDGVFFDNLYELYAAMFQGMVVTAWAIYQIALPFPNGPQEYILIAVTGLAQIFYFSLSYPLRSEYAWRVYRVVGADSTFRGIYRTYLIWLTVLKIDILYSLSSSFLSGYGVFNTGYLQAIDICMIIFVILFFTIGYFAVKNEAVYMSYAWFCLFPIGPTYLIYNLYASWNNFHDPDADYSVRGLAGLYTVTCCISLIGHLTLIAFTVKVFNNYNKGLKKLEFLKVDDTSELPEDYDEDYVEYQSESEVPYSVTDVIKNTHALSAEK